MELVKSMIDIRFQHVKAHSGVKGNTLADKLAKAAATCGETHKIKIDGDRFMVMPA